MKASEHDSSIQWDELLSLPESPLTNFVGILTPRKLEVLNQTLRIALELPDQPEAGSEK